MAIFSFRTIAGRTEGFYKEKGSRFIACAIPVETEEQIKEKLEKLRKEYFDARHHCYAWMLGPDKKRFRAADDGEPSHSAGDPILGQIRSKEITNVLVVVVRYFGGTKLGVGGLITAYKTASADALDKAEIIEKDIHQSLTITFDYTATPEVMKLIKDFDLTIVEQSFGTRCMMILEYKLIDEPRLLEKIRLLSVTGTALEIVEQ
jgi:uncharacterized YigZ family protein